MRNMMKVLFLCLAVVVAARGQAAEIIVIPLVEDPTPIVDADLGDWTSRDRGLLLRLDQSDHLTYNKNNWGGVKDLSGWVRLGYDAQCLYVACQVIDDVVTQESSGESIWRGDHVIIFLDFVRSGRWEDTIQIGLSPGSLKGDGDAGARLKPEAIVWRPAGISPEGIVVAAHKTADG